MKELANQIMGWLKNYAETNNRKAFVLGVSGGVDSALVSTLCAMTGLPTHCVVLPCESKTDETDRGMLHISWLEKQFPNVRFHQMDLTSTFQAFVEECCRGDKSIYFSELGFANSKSRLRMIALYQIATCVGGLVVGTGNKVEDFGLGFCTKGGDGLVDISPIANLTKTEVRAMCRALGVLPELSEAIATDGLWDDGRTDESQLGASYPELEWAMEWRETTISESSSLLTDRQKEILAIYDKWHNSTRHKFDPTPTFRRKIDEQL